MVLTLSHGKINSIIDQCQNFFSNNEVSMREIAQISEKFCNSIIARISHLKVFFKIGALKILQYSHPEDL